MLPEVWPFTDAHRRAGRPVVLARLVGRDGPGARPLGATVAVAADGTWRGSVSGGCVEAQVLDAARAVLDGGPPGLVTVSPAAGRMPWEDTPACAGELRLLVTPAPPPDVHDAITAALRDDRPITVRTALHPPFTWTVGAEVADAFTDHLPRRRRLVLAGATDLAAVLATLAHPLHRAVTIVDPRPGHTGSGAFPGTATVIEDWPERWIARQALEPADAVVALSHDPRIDDGAVRAALRGRAGHVAALGSRATHAARLRRLAGVPGLDRLAGPAGLDLGGASLAETALSVLAEIVAVANGRDGDRLRDGDRPIRATTAGAQAG